MFLKVLTGKPGNLTIIFSLNSKCLRVQTVNFWNFIHL